MGGRAWTSIKQGFEVVDIGASCQDALCEWIGSQTQRPAGTQRPWITSSAARHLGRTFKRK